MAAVARTTPLDELALNRRSPSDAATVHSAVRVAGWLPTLGGGVHEVRALTSARRHGRGEAV
jgi:hypothetical protein